jgi:general stress protein 26
MKKLFPVAFFAVFVSLAFCAAAGSEEARTPEMSAAKMKEVALQLYQSQPVVTLVTIDENGYPEARAMANLRQTGALEGNVFPADSLDTAFGTSSWRSKIEQVKKNPKASVYILDVKTYRAASILGTIEIVSEPEAKKAYWSKAFSALYPQGPASPSYTVLRFKAEALKIHAADRNAPFISLKK